MTVLPVLTWPDPRLGEVCAPVGRITPDIERLAANLLETMYAAPGRGLAGPQVGAMLRIFVMDAGWKSGTPSPLVMVDPELLEASDEHATASEGCLSLPGVLAEVTRPARVRMGWTALDGQRREQDFDGFEALCAQHELDHLEGRMTLDHLTPEARNRLLSEYGATP